nr:cullin, conserved site-containing protein [Tanacetum cinerariifolium]
MQHPPFLGICIFKNIYCSLCRPGKNYCDVSEDETTQAVREMNFKISSQNPVTGDTYHANLNANYKTLPNGWKKNKSRLNGSESSQVETLHSSMDGRQKRKRLSEANHQLLAKNIVNKPIDVGRNAATVNESSVDKSHEKNLNATSSRKDLESKCFQFGATSSSSKAPNLDKVSPAAGRTISRKAHAKSSIRPGVPRKLLAREDNMQRRDIDASQIQKLGGTFEFKRKEASKFTGSQCCKVLKRVFIESNSYDRLQKIRGVEGQCETLSRLGAFKRDDETNPTGDAFTSCKLALLKEPETFEELKLFTPRPGKNYYNVSEDETTQAIREMNFKISSQNQVTGDTYHANSNANSEKLPNGWNKNKYRLDGEPRLKKLKTMADLDKHDHLTSTKIKNENERQTKIHELPRRVSYWIGKAMKKWKFLQRSES